MQRWWNVGGLLVLLGLLLGLQHAHALNNETINPLPDTNSASIRTDSQTFWQKESPAVLRRYAPLGFVIQGGTHGTSASCTSAPFSVEAVTQASTDLSMGGNRVTGGQSDGALGAAVSGTGTAVAINYASIANCANPGSASVRVVVCAVTGNTVGSFTRFAGSNYFGNATSANLTTPDDCQGLMTVTITNGAIASITDIRQPVSYAFRHVRDVRDTLYGAKGDGTTNDAAAIQTAIDQLPTSTALPFQAGGGVFLPRGSYYLGNAATGLTFCKGNGQVLQGESTEATVLLYDGTGVALQSATTGMHSRCKLRDLTIKLTNGSGVGGAGATGVDWRWASYSEFANLSITLNAAQQTAFYATGSADGTTTTPYYNTFFHNDVNGSGAAGQTGYNFDCASSVAVGAGPFSVTVQCPNGNWVGGGGRLSSLGQHFVLNGAGNTITTMFLEASVQEKRMFNIGLSNPAITGATSTGAGTNNTLVDTSRNWTASTWQNGVLHITAGTGSGQWAEIRDNTATTYTINGRWPIIPDATSVYDIYLASAIRNTSRDLYMEGVAYTAWRLRPGAFGNTIDSQQISGATTILSQDLYRPSNRISVSGLSASLKPVTFTKNAVAANQSSVVLATGTDWAPGGGNTLVGDWPLYSGNNLGYVVGVIVYASQARTAGSLTVTPTIDGTTVPGLATVLNAANPQFMLNFTPELNNSIAIDLRRLGVVYTTDAAWAPAGAGVNIVVTVWLKLPL